MAKNKSPNKKNLEQDLKRLYDHVDDQQFKTIEELQAFLNQMVGKKIDDIIPKAGGEMSKKEESSAVLQEAYDATTKAKGRKLAEKALELDPDNADAYSFLGGLERNVRKALKFYEQGMEAGRRAIGEKEFGELKGHFWGFHQTRPYMRAKAEYAECLYTAGKHDESIAQFAEMIELNPNDNQGIRYRYASLLVWMDRFAEYEALVKLYPDEGSALWLFTYALYLFKQQGASEKANQALEEAQEANPYVIPFLLGFEEMPDEMPAYYSWGDENEAVVYLNEAANIWLEYPAALQWANTQFDGEETYEEGMLEDLSTSIGQIKELIDSAYEQGRADQILDFAATMKTNGEPTAKIKKYTGLTKKEIDNL